MPALRNAKREAFCQEYLVDLDATKALFRAGYKPTKRSTAANMANQLMGYPEVGERIRELMAERSARVSLEADDVLRRYSQIATADPRALMQHRRGACRFCHGIDHAYQWRTPREYDDARSAWEAEYAAEADRETPRPAVMARLRATEPVESGGYGYSRNLSPNPFCPECDGYGIGFTVLADTASLPPEAAILFDAVEETDKGTKIKTLDRMHALDQVARHLGMFDRENAGRPVADALGDLIRHIQTTGSRAPIVPVPPQEPASS